MKFLIIENDPTIAKIYNDIGIEYIFIDLEIIGKVERQGHLNTVISSHHKMEDIFKVKKVLNRSKLLVRCNPIHENSENEIHEIISNGADAVMLPFFKSHLEVEKFLSFTNKRVETILLLETPEAFCRIDRILEIEGIDKIHIGLNDLHLGMGLSFMFELISNGVVEFLVKKLTDKNVSYGIGGIANLDGGLISGKHVLTEYVRLNSSMTILSRSMTNSYKDNISGLSNEILKLRNFEIVLKTYDNSYFIKEQKKFIFEVNKIVNNKLLNL